MQEVEGVTDGDVQEYQGVSAVFGDGGGEVVAGVDVEGGEGGVHPVEFVVEFGEVGVWIPRGGGLVTGPVDVGYYATPCGNHSGIRLGMGWGYRMK